MSSDAVVKEALAAGSERPPQPPSEAGAAEPGLYAALAAWRRERSQSDEVPAFHVFPNRVLEAIAEAQPGSREELAEVSGVGPAKLERYGEDVLRVVAAARGLSCPTAVRRRP